jgi:hypothetical protein
LAAGEPAQNRAMRGGPHFIYTRETQIFCKEKTPDA